MSPDGNTWPGAYPASGITAGLKVRPEDFEVEEILGFEPDGTGEHLLVRVRKRGLNTNEAARRLAEYLELPRSDISWAGRKDKHAIAYQYFSIHWPDENLPELAGLDSDALQVLDLSRHKRKLRPGHNQGNRFRLRLSNLEGNSSGVDRRLRLLASHGVPNYFGLQRFGRESRNVEAAREMLAKGDLRRVARNRRSMLLSAARSYLFNQVLAARVAAGTWNRILPGELVMLEGTRSFFLANEVTPDLQARLEAHDISPSGPLPGLIRKEAPEGEALQVEREALSGEIALVDSLVGVGVLAARRPLRLMPRGLQWRLNDDGDLLLEFELPSGAYATTVIAELAQVRTDEAGPAVAH